jgi:hypothetical protein
MTGFVRAIPADCNASSTALTISRRTTPRRFLSVAPLTFLSALVKSTTYFGRGEEKKISGPKLESFSHLMEDDFIFVGWSVPRINKMKNHSQIVLGCQIFI